MDDFRSNLLNISSALPPISPNPPAPTRLASLTPHLLALLHTSDTESPTIRLISTSNPPSPTLTIGPHPAIPNDATTILPAQDMFAVTSPTAVCVIEPFTTPPAIRRVADPLFSRRPTLRLLHAAFSPHAHAFLMLLTSDGSLRLYDVVSQNSAATERFRLRVVTAGASPLSFAFGRSPGWDALSVYILAEDGELCVAAPIAPIGTRIPTNIWRALRDAARRVLDKEVNKTASNPDPFTTRAESPRRMLDFSTSEPAATNDSWTLRQAQMQVRFLERVFESSSSGDMVAVREFKPAPLLFQGPLYIEQDDASSSPSAFSSLTLLHCGHAHPPILLRGSKQGDLSALISLEKVEAQWFLSDDPFATTGDAALEASEEYTAAASAVAPLLLCFEHMTIPGPTPVVLFPLGGKTNADILFAVSGSSVYSIRLSFVSVLLNSSALEQTPKSSISLLLSTSTASNSERGILGVASSYVKGQGPVAIALTSDANLHVSNPIKWVSGFDTTLPPSLLSSRPSADISWNSERPLTGNRAFACPEIGKEVMNIVHHVQKLEGQHGGRVAPGTLGVLRNIQSYPPALEFLEEKIAVFTGGSEGAGIGDSLGNLASVLTQWSDELKQRCAHSVNEVGDVDCTLAEVENSEAALKMKLRRVEEVNSILKERMVIVLQALESGNSELSPVERERYNKLKEKKRRVASLRRRVEEISTAVRAQKAAAAVESSHADASFQSPMRNAPSPLVTRSPLTGSASRRPKRWSASPAWRDADEPLARRKPEWTPPRDRVELGRTELQQIKAALEKHSQEIAEALELSSKLWKRLSAV